jgi:hypothetical protein
MAKVIKLPGSRPVQPDTLAAQTANTWVCGCGTVNPKSRGSCRNCEGGTK